MKALILFCPGYSPPNIVILTIGGCGKKKSKLNSFVAASSCNAMKFNDDEIRK